MFDENWKIRESKWIKTLHYNLLQTPANEEWSCKRTLECALLCLTIWTDPKSRNKNYITRSKLNCQDVKLNMTTKFNIAK